MDDIMNHPYNGWENKFTWLVHLHLSNEQALFLEMAHLVGSEPDDACAGRLVEQWVRSAITKWMNRLPGRDRRFDEHLCLLTWDVLGASLAHTEWDDLVTLLSGGERVSNVLTMTLHHRIRQAPQLHSYIAMLLRHATSLVAAADALKAWFEALLVEWIDQAARRRPGETLVTMLFSGLLYKVYDLVVWEHVAQAFRPGH